MGNSPYDFVINHSDYQLQKADNFVHRTFNAIDFKTFIKSLQNIYINHNGLESVFANNQEADFMQKSISQFKRIFFSIPHQNRTEKPRFPIRSIIPQPNALICFFVGWFAKITTASISEFGKPFLLPNFHVRSMFIQEMLPEN